jgi:hypothetical protein
MTEEDPFFAELNAEIAKATAKSRLKSDAAKLKRDSLNMRLDIHTRRRAAEEFKSLQAIVEANAWEAVRCAAMFAQQQCDGCGSIHTNFLQFMQEEEKITNRSTCRWTRVPVPAANLPRETIIQPLNTHICADCCKDHGFSVAAPEIKLLPLEGALTVSPSYLQGDINAPPQED